MKVPMKKNSRLIRAITVMLLLCAVATAITRSAPATSAQEKVATPNRLEITRTDESTISFSLTDERGTRTATGQIVSNDRERSRTFTVNDASGQLAEITTQQTDKSHIRIAVSSRSQNGEWNFEIARLHNLYSALPNKESLKNLDKENRETLKDVGRLRRAMTEAIGADLRTSIVEALSQAKSDSTEAQALAGALAARHMIGSGDASRPHDCIFAAQWYYGICTTLNHNMDGQCLLEAIMEFWECVIDNIIEEMPDI